MYRESPDGNLLPTKAMPEAQDKAASSLTAPLRDVDHSSFYTGTAGRLSRPDGYIEPSIC